MTFDPQELKEILSIYKAESDEHLQKLNENLILLEKESGRSDLIEEIFREAHSLKGSARMIGFEAVERIAHRLEDLFSAVRKGELDLGPGTYDVIFRSLDAVSRLTEKWLADPAAELEDVSGLLGEIAAEHSPKKISPPAPRRKDAPADTGRRKTAPEKKPGKDELKAGKKKEQKKAPAEPVRLEVEETIRVTTHKLDDLMNQIGEILVTKIKFDQRMAEVRRLESDLEEINREWITFQRQSNLRPTAHSSEEREHLALMQRETGQKISVLHEGFSRFASSFNEDNLRMTLISSELQESINRVRMLPLSSLFNLMPRLLRDIVRGEGKEVELTVEGEGIQLDKQILEQLKDPLMHILRNAIDHGIESPEERISAGKKSTGRIHLSATQKANSVVIDIADDGAGIDPEQIRDAALRRGFVKEEQLQEMSEQQVMSLVFQPGFSTRGIITDLSGRGVGLDVVFSNIEKMKGSVNLSSEPGKGSTFSIKLPVSLATSQALVVRISNQVFAIPLTSVEIITEIGVEDLITLESREAIIVGGVPTALIRVNEVLGLPADGLDIDDGDRASVVVIGSTDERVALVVTEVIGEKEIVIKGLGTQLRRVRNFSGATIMGDGSVVLIINVFDVIKSSQKVRGVLVSGKKEEKTERAKPRILVVDDSVTTRVLEKNILEGSGYRVTLAVDGVEGLEKMRAKDFDLVVTDVEMPRMDGFELTRRLRKQKKFRDLPIILVTSLDSDEDKRRGIEAGADAYITKGAFEQGNLLATIKQLL